MKCKFQLARKIFGHLNFQRRNPNRSNFSELTKTFIHCKELSNVSLKLLHEYSLWVPLDCYFKLKDHSNRNSFLENLKLRLCSLKGDSLVNRVIQFLFTGNLSQSSFNPPTVNIGANSSPNG